MRYTIGEMIDKLSIINLKIWHTEEHLRDSKISKKEKGHLCQNIVKLNNLRIKCIKAIDEYFDDND